LVNGDFLSGSLVVLPAGTCSTGAVLPRGCLAAACFSLDRFAGAALAETLLAGVFFATGLTPLCFAGAFLAGDFFAAAFFAAAFLAGAFFAAAI
jgi:hypothetical protein